MTRSSLHRLFQRHGSSQLPSLEGDRAKKFKSYPISYFYIDIAQVRTEESKLFMLVAIDWVSKVAYAQLHERATRCIAADFSPRVIAHVPYKIHSVLTDNGIHFTTPGNNCSAAADIKLALEKVGRLRAHALKLACAQNHIDHHLTKPNPPWTNGQVESNAPDHPRSPRATLHFSRLTVLPGA